MKESCETAMAARRHTSKKPAVQTDGSEPSAPADTTAEHEAVGNGESAAASPSVGALPEHDATRPVSDAQLLSLVGKEDQEVEAFWMKCSSRQQQQLWYSFRSLSALIALQDFCLHMNSESAYKYMLWDLCGLALAPIMLSLEPPQQHLQTTEEKLHCISDWHYEVCCKAGWRHLVWFFFGNPAH